MPYSNQCSYFVFQIFCRRRDKLLKFLKSKNIGVSVHYANPLPKMTYYKKKYKLSIKKFPAALKYGLTNISLPIYPKLKNSEVDNVCKAITSFIRNSI